MTWTPHHNIRIAREICGYEVQTSPRGVHYVVEDGKTRPLPDFPNDPGETLTTLEAWLKVTPQAEARLGQGQRYKVRLMSRDYFVTYSTGRTMAEAVAKALYMTLPPEAPQ